MVNLTAIPNGQPPSKFGAWQGACTGTKSTCRLTMNATTSTTATFVPKSSDPG